MHISHSSVPFKLLIMLQPGAHTDWRTKFVLRLSATYREIMCWFHEMKRDVTARRYERAAWVSDSGN